MKKKLLIFILLSITFSFLASPIYAEDENNSSSIWEKIKNFFTSFITNKKIDIDRDAVATTYSNDPNYPGDLTTRVIPESDRIQKKLRYVTGVIDGKYKNQTLGKCPNSDKNITILDLAYYLLQKNYLSLNATSQENLKKHTPPSSFNGYCYDKLFQELHVVPPEEQEKDKDTLTINETSRYIIPAESQESNLSEVKNIKEDTAKQTETMYKQIVPKDSQGSTYKELKEQFASWLTPHSWQKP